MFACLSVIIDIEAVAFIDMNFGEKIGTANPPACDELHHITLSLRRCPLHTKVTFSLPIKYQMEAYKSALYDASKGRKRENAAMRHAPILKNYPTENREKITKLSLYND